MAFESLSGKLQGVINKLKGKSRVTEEDVKEITREVKLALLEADVNYKIVKDFTAKISEKALGQDVRLNSKKRLLLLSFALLPNSRKLLIILGPKRANAAKKASVLTILFLKVEGRCR